MLYALLMTTIPPICGILSLRAISGVLGIISANDRAIICCSGVYCGYLVNSYIIFSLDKFGISNSLSLSALILVAISTVLHAGAIARSSRTGSNAIIGRALLRPQTDGHERIALCTLFFLLVTLVYVQTYISSTIPVFGWDVLGHWGRWPYNYIRFDAIREAGEIFPRTEHRHPFTIVALNAYSAFWSSKWDGSSGWLLATVITSFATALATMLYAYSKTKNLSFTALLGYAYVSTPLLENHSLILGYADLWIEMGMAFASLYVVLALGTRSRPLLLMALLVMLTLLSIKNTGFLYAAILLAAICIATVSAFIRYGILITLVGSFFIFAININSVDFDFNFMGLRFAFAPGQSQEIVFAGYTKDFILAEPIAVIKSQLLAFFLRSSFSVLPMAAMLIIFFSIKSVIKRQGRLGREEGFLFLVLLGLLAYSTTFQLNTAYLVTYAGESDLGNSRFSLAIIPITLLSIAAIVSKTISPERSPP